MGLTHETDELFSTPQKLPNDPHSKIQKVQEINKYILMSNGIEYTNEI